MYSFKENCVKCGKEFLNNSGCTSFGCPQCEHSLREHEFLGRQGSERRSPYERRKSFVEYVTDQMLSPGLIWNLSFRVSDAQIAEMESIADVRKRASLCEYLADQVLPEPVEASLDEIDEI
jgi:predicted RNA-binding Zn-ribbon protein involved in translation (DUF1610 family)